MKKRNRHKKCSWIGSGSGRRQPETDSYMGSSKEWNKLTEKVVAAEITDNLKWKLEKYMNEEGRWLKLTPRSYNVQVVWPLAVSFYPCACYAASYSKAKQQKHRHQVINSKASAIQMTKTHFDILLYDSTRFFPLRAVMPINICLSSMAHNGRAQT